MKKVGIVTVHAAHNYGSCLQAYALQKKIEELNCDCDIINLRLPIQREIYKVITKRISLKYILKNMYTLLFIYKSRCLKHKKFEDFILHKMRLSEEANSIEVFSKIANKYDCVITGSDQIWNLGIEEFTDAYLLQGVRNKKISYAVSCGENIESNFTQKQKEYIKAIDFISVRDSVTAQLVKTVTNKDVDIVLDPTMLFDGNFYQDLYGEERLIKEKYIYLYTLGNSKELLEVSKRLSKKTGLPIYISNVSGTHYMFGLKKQIAAGPEEFLNHIKYAEYVITSSFHGTVFSILFNKQFWVFKAESDARKRELLHLTGLSDRTIDIQNCEEKFKSIILDNQYKIVHNMIFAEREKSVDFLNKALGNQYL